MSAVGPAGPRRPTGGEKKRKHRASVGGKKTVCPYNFVYLSLFFFWKQVQKLFLRGAEKTLPVSYERNLNSCGARAKG